MHQGNQLSVRDELDGGVERESWVTTYEGQHTLARNKNTTVSSGREESAPDKDMLRWK